MRTQRYDRGIERQDACRIVGCRIRMCDASADRSLIPNLNVADQARGISQRGKALPNHYRAFDGVMRRECANANPASILFYVRKFRDAPDIDQELGGCEPELHHGNQAMTTRHDLCATRVFL